VIALIFIAYFLADIFFWPSYLLYVFTPWIVVNVALIGSLTKNWINGAPTRNNIITLTLLIIIFLFAVTKIVFFVLYNTVLKNKIRPHKPVVFTADRESLQRSVGMDVIKNKF
jgi:hypothetical protein